MRYRFDEVELDTAAYELRVDGTRVPVEPQVFEVLAYLLEHRDRVVPRTEILDAVWGDRFVSDSALASRIAAARAAIGDDGTAQRYIRTVHGRGVQVVADVEVVAAAAPPIVRREATDRQQTVRFVRSRDGTELAVASVGTGTPMIKVANWMTHVDKDWDSPVWRHWIGALGDRFRFIRYDSRGCGLSERDLGDSDLTDIDVWIDDLTAVVDNHQVDRFVLYGMSQGAIPAVAYAAQHPERVSHLVIYGGYRRGMRRRGDSATAEASTILDLIRVGWGGTNPAFRSFFTMMFLPEATSEQIRWFNQLQADTSTAANAARLEEAFYDVDIGDLAAQVTVPTLVLHCRDDAATPYDEGRRLAAAIPGAEFVTLDSPNHILLDDEAAWPDFLAHVDEFVGRDQA